MILFIDNYDSFTFNLVDLIGQIEHDLIVKRNDQISIANIYSLNPKAIVISPGPGFPQNAGISCDIVRELSPDIPILGICLGHQAIGHVFGAAIIRGNSPVHGKTSLINHNGTGVFNNVPSPLQATRYHSLIIDKKTIPDCLQITAFSDDGVIMGIRHILYPITGLQFHPESVLTPLGSQLLNNWLNETLDFHSNQSVNTSFIERA